MRTQLSAALAIVLCLASGATVSFHAPYRVQCAAFAGAAVVGVVYLVRLHFTVDSAQMGARAIFARRDGKVVHADNPFRIRLFRLFARRDRS